MYQRLEWMAGDIAVHASTSISSPDFQEIVSTVARTCAASQSVLTRYKLRDMEHRSLLQVST